jgi:monothiol bacilliredoxin
MLIREPRLVNHLIRKISPLMSKALLASLPPTGWQASLSRQRLTVLFKHSPICGTSAAALEHILDFVAANATIPVYLLDVLAERALSQNIARNLNVPHASPQAIVVRWGVPVWTAQHGGVTAVALEGAIRAGTAA